MTFEQFLWCEHHKCSFYCRNGIHALEILCDPEMDASEIAESLPRLIMRDFGAHVTVHIRPAHEAVLEEWRKKIEVKSPLHTQPWIAELRAAPPACDTQATKG